MKASVLAFGKLRTPGLREAADHYLKLIQPWLPLAEVELKPVEVADKSPAARRDVQAREATLLLAKLDDVVSNRGRIWLLDEGGRAMTSEQWAQALRECEDGAVSTVALCIGGSMGFSDEVRKRAHLKVSLGPQTLSHQLARVVLYEQLYRAMSILRGHPYHHAGS